MKEFDFTYTPKDGSKQAEKDVKEILEILEEDELIEREAFLAFCEEKGIK